MFPVCGHTARSCAKSYRIVLVFHGLLSTRRYTGPAAKRPYFREFTTSITFMRTGVADDGRDGRFEKRVEVKDERMNFGTPVSC
jgi:hypothetical protein